jgi:hypothetical protein
MRALYAEINFIKRYLLWEKNARYGQQKVIFLLKEFSLAIAVGLSLHLNLEQRLIQDLLSLYEE